MNLEADRLQSCHEIVPAVNPHVIVLPEAALPLLGCVDAGVPFGYLEHQRTANRLDGVGEST
jgi:hypothetical protein